MQANNKIKARAQDIDVESAQFQQFVTALKEQRPNKQSRVQQPEYNHSVASHPIISEQESSPISKELFSEGSRSLYLQANRTSNHFTNNFGGDQTLRNKGRLGVANRYAVKQYQLPPQYFTPTKLKLQQFLKDSRILPNAEGVANTKKIMMNHRGGQTHNEILPSDESKLVKGDNKGLKICELNSELVLKYCIAYELSQHSQPRQIQQFFMKLLQIVDFTIAAPKIEKFRECIFLGKGTKKRQIGQGFLYFYSGSFYFGELLEHYMHGAGTQIFFNMRSIYRGNFNEGAMQGNFTVIKSNQKYQGMIQNGLYHGYGKLHTKQGTIQGEFRQGEFIGNIAKHSFPKNQSHFRIRGGSQQRPQYEESQSYHYQKNKSFNDHSYKQQQADIDPWSFPQRTSRTKKSRPHNNFSQIIQFSYPFGHQFAGQQPKKQKVHINTKEIFHNPQTSIRNRLSLPRQNLRQMGYMNRVKPIREETDFGQQQPLESKC